MVDARESYSSQQNATTVSLWASRGGGDDFGVYEIQI